MRIRVPNKRVREKFNITYELKGCQVAVDFLCEHYQVRRMRVTLDGKRVGKKFLAYYEKRRATFKKRGLTKRVVLHEFYHHLAECKKLDIPERTEEKNADNYARMFLRC